MSCRGLLLLCLMLVGTTAQGHVASNAFLELDAHGRDLTGSIELAVRDVELAVGVDADGDGRITWGELRAAEPRLDAYLEPRLTLSAGHRGCEVRFGSLRVNARVDGNYAYLPLSAHCAESVHELEIRYRILDDVDPSHRGLLRLTAGTALQAVVLGGRRPKMTLAIDRPAPWRTFAEYFEAGTAHIFGGIDHLLFLLSLLLPAVLRRRGSHWEPVECGRPALWSILKVVTAFTVAHSITLSLAAFNLVHLPSRLTESVIAASIIVAALNNVVPIVTDSRARIAFVFGLLHGFGFASVLAEMGLPATARLACLVAFNLGIEAGQLAVVSAVMPLAYASRRLNAYRRAILPWGSAAIALIALVWFIERAFLPA